MYLTKFAIQQMVKEIDASMSQLDIEHTARENQFIEESESWSRQHQEKFEQATDKLEEAINDLGAAKKNLEIYNKQS